MTLEVKNSRIYIDEKTFFNVSPSKKIYESVNDQTIYLSEIDVFYFDGSDGYIFTKSNYFHFDIIFNGPGGISAMKKIYQIWLDYQHQQQNKMQKEITELKQTVEELKNIILYSPPNNGGSEFQKAKTHFGSLSEIKN